MRISAGLVLAAWLAWAVGGEAVAQGEPTAPQPPMAAESPPAAAEPLPAEPQGGTAPGASGVAGEGVAAEPEGGATEREEGAAAEPADAAAKPDAEAPAAGGAEEGAPAASAAAAAVAPPYLISVLKSEQPYETANGSFVYRIDLDLPPFHGIEPKLKLVYSSSRKLNAGGESQGWLGFGWKLDGLHVIEAASNRRGAPRYSGDIYLWNGEEIHACGPSHNSAPSCQTGGDYYAKVESYRRILYNDPDNTWRITDRDGTRYTLQPVGFFMPGSTSQPVEHRTKYRWLLRSIRDTRGNEVTLDYSCDDNAPQCELLSISYTGTLVRFLWEDRLDIVSYATGVGIGKAKKRLKVVRVDHGGLAQKAYALGYGQNPVSGLSRIVRVTQYGKDFAIDGGVITGTALPPHQFTYSEADTIFDDGPGLPSGTVPTFADVNGDGRDDVAFFEAKTGYYDVPNIEQPEDRVELFDTPLRDNPPPPAEIRGRQTLVGYFNADKYLDFLFTRVVDPDGDNNSTYTNLSAFLSTGPGAYNSTTNPSFVDDPSAKTFYVRDSNGDGIDEVRAGDDVADSKTYIPYDFDGDGIADRLVADSQINLSTGGSFMLPVSNCTTSQHCVFADVNGDGLTDLIHVTRPSTATVRVYLTRGRFGLDPVFETTGIDAKLEGMVGADVNGDGRAELILGRTNPQQGEPNSFVLLIRDNAIVPMPNWRVQSFTHPQGLAITGDFNGDGITDIRSQEDGQFSVARGPVDNLMATASNGYGGKATITYRPSSRWTNDRLPMVEQTVDRIVVVDGRGWSATTDYSYANGAYNFAQRRFLGFASQVELPPCVPGETTCPRIQRVLSQDLAAVGAVKVEIVRRGDDSLLRLTERTYSANNASVPFTALMTEERVRHYENPGSGGSPDYLLTRQTYEYDAYGNVRAFRDYGRDAVPDDEHSIFTYFAPNTSAYIASLKAREDVHDGTSQTPETLIRRVSWVYDGQANFGVPPIEGDVTRRETWIDSSGALAIDRFEYDPYGNRTRAIDPEGSETTWSYESLHLYPDRETNDLGQFIETTWNFPCGLPAVETDLNGIDTITTYDVFCRRERVERTVGGAYEAFNYSSFGIAGEQYVQKRRPHPNGGGEIAERQYFDGLGRIWRDWKTSTNAAGASSTTRVDREFDNRSNLWRQTHPYYQNETAYRTIYRYDGLNRVLQEQNPDGTAKTFVHDIDRRLSIGGQVPLTKIVTTDEIGRDVDVTSDAAGNPIEVVRYLGTTPVREERRFDRLGNLLRVVDDAGNAWIYTYDFRGLRRSSNDPDLGQWSYVYNKAGRLRWRTDARNLAVIFSYDGLWRVEKRTEQRPGGGDDTVDYEYDEDRAPATTTLAS